MDGALYAIGPLVAFCTVLLIIAEPLRNTGTYTLGDVIHYRMKRPPALAAAVLGTIVINLAYMVPQMAGGGVLLKLLFGLPYHVSVVLVGLGMIVYVAAGGMLATSWVQIVKAVLLLSAGAIVLLMALWQIGFDPLVFFSADEARYGPSFLLPGNLLKNPWDEVSLGLGYVLGLAGLPHVMTRFYTVPDAKTARRSVVWVMFLAGAFFACTTIFGLAAAHFVGQDAIRAADRGGNLTLPLLAQYLGGGQGSAGGEIMLAFIAAVAVATIIAVVAGLTLATSGAIAHDLYVDLIRKGNVHERAQVMAARITAITVGIVATLLGILADGRQRRSAGDPGDLYRRERQLSGIGPLVVLAPFQYRRRDRRDGIRTDLVRRARTDRPGLSRQGCAVAAGQSDCGGSAARNLGRRARDTYRRSQQRA
jgi:cation/acetate symporter